MADKMNVVEQAVKVTSFRKVIREECRKQGLEYPSDAKIAEWISKGYGWSIEEFMNGYKEKQGIFRDPITDFVKEINKIKVNWAKQPTDEDIRAWAEKNGCNKSKFLMHQTLSEMKPIVRNTCLATIAMTDENLVKLWNIFIEESAKYGEDSYIYNLDDEKDSKDLADTMKPEELIKAAKIATEGSTKFIQWFSLNDGSIHAKKNIKGIIVAYWEEIFERIMVYPKAYAFNTNLYAKEDCTDYFGDVFFPVIAKELGYVIDAEKGTISCEK